MKTNYIKFIFILSIFLVVSIRTNAQKTTISGKIDGKSLARTKVVNVEVNGNSYAVNVNDQLEFSTDIEIKEPQFIMFQLGSITNYMYVIPNRSVKISATRESNNKPVVFIREDKELAIIDGVITTLFNSLEDQGVKISSKNWLQEIIDKPEALDKAINAANENYNANDKIINKIAPNFKNNLALIGDTFKKYVAIDNYSLEKLESLLKDLSNTNIKVSYLSLPFFKEYLNDLTTAYAALKLERYNLDLEPLKYRLALNTIIAEAIAMNINNQEIKNNLFYGKINNELKGYGITHETYLNYLFENVDRQAVEDLYANYTKIKEKANSNAKREALIPFTVIDVDGNTHTMDEFKGKMVYIDFWASWCAPCKGQIPFIKKLEKHYEGKDILFIGISLDSNKEAWLKSVKMEGLHGNTFLGEGAFEHPVAKHYNIKSIPRFMLLDAAGNIISDDAIRPSQTEDLMKIINEELYKKELSVIVDKHLNKIGAKKLLNGTGVGYQTKQSVMGIDVFANTYYEFPNKVLMESFPIGVKSRDDKKLMSSTAMNGDKFSGKIDNIEKFKQSILTRLPGLELFIMVNELTKTFGVAKENFTNQDNEYVLQTTIDENVIKVFIGKDDLLMHKMLRISPVSPRNGGGTSSFSFVYGDYKEVNGVWLPHKLNINSMLDSEVEKVEVENFDDSLFTIEQ